MYRFATNNVHFTLISKSYCLLGWSFKMLRLVLFIPWKLVTFLLRRLLSFQHTAPLQSFIYCYILQLMVSSSICTWTFRHTFGFFF